jgi:hypothetical protein
MTTKEAATGRRVVVQPHSMWKRIGIAAMSFVLPTFLAARASRFQVSHLTIRGKRLTII